MTVNMVSEEVILTEENITSVCRTCLKQETEEMFSVYQKITGKYGYGNKDTPIYDLLAEVTTIKVESVMNNINLSTLICGNCLELLKLLFDFKQECIKSQMTFNDYTAKTVLVKEEIFEESEESEEEKEEEEEQEEEVDKKDFEFNNINLNNNEQSKNDNIYHSDIGHILDQEQQDSNSDINVSNVANADKHKKLYKCPVCHRKLTSKFNYEKHMEKHKHENTTCDICNKTFAYKRLLYMHFKKVHEVGKNKRKGIRLVRQESSDDESSASSRSSSRSSSPEPGPKYACHMCDRTFAYKKSYIKHVKVHGDLLNTCPICKEKFRSLAAVKEHMKRHGDTKAFNCDLCDRKFAQKSGLVLHQFAHARERSFGCAICEERVSTRNQLEQHMKRHTGEKEFKCEECDKAFFLRRHLKAHEVSHLGLKPFKCDICEKSFARKKTLKSHLGIHVSQNASLTCQKLVELI